MGKKAPADSAAARAAAGAAERGLEVFAYRQNVRWLQSGFSGEIGGMGEAIGAIESQGWRLDKMAFDGMQSSNGGCILLFRRAPQPPQQPVPQQWQQQPQPGPGQWPPR